MSCLLLFCIWASVPAVLDVWKTTWELSPSSLPSVQLSLFVSDPSFSGGQHVVERISTDASSVEHRNNGKRYFNAISETSLIWKCVHVSTNWILYKEEGKKFAM